MKPKPVEFTKNSDIDISIFRRAFVLAGSSIGVSSPNPSVGAIIIDRKSGEIIGEGATREPGREHAEIVAIDSVKKRFPDDFADQLADSVLYVTLEPCAHFGRTPPCSLAILQNNIPEINIALKDPSEKVNGRSIDALINAGRKVKVLEKGFLMEHFAEEVAFTLGPFLCAESMQRPMILLKWAQTASGFVAPALGSSGHISNGDSRALVHRMRRLSGATLTFPGSVRFDWPELNFRDHLRDIRIRWAAGSFFQSLQDGYLRNQRFFPSVQGQTTRLFLLPRADSSWDRDSMENWILRQKNMPEEYGRPLFIYRGEDPSTDNYYKEVMSRHSLDYIRTESLEEFLRTLPQAGITSLLMEAGPRGVSYLMKNNMADMAMVFTSGGDPFSQGVAISPSAAKSLGAMIPLSGYSVGEINPDTLHVYLSRSFLQVADS